MKKNTLPLLILALSLLAISPAFAAKPLKVYILAGQSNMEGHARIRTIDAMRGDPEVADLYKAMTDKNGKPITVDGVHIVYGDRSGKLDASFGATHRGPKIGPEYAFGITMQKSVEEPILLIKTAWAGKGLIQQFRPPSAGDFEKETDEHGNKTGHFYREMIKGVQKVLADPGKYHPDYDKDAGYEIAGFVWFQGYHDLTRNYPSAYPKLNPDDKRSIKDYSEYSRLMACLIRDVRKDLSAPEMKFVIGAVGMGGEDASEIKGTPSNSVTFQRAQAAPADMPEFKDTVAAVYTAKFWDHKLAEVAHKAKGIRKSTARHAKRKKVDFGEAFKKALAENLTEKERQLLGSASDEPLHYLGSAKIYSRIGKAFAESMLSLEKK